MERRGGRPLRIGERILVSYRSDGVWHERLLIRALTEKTWLIVTPDGDLYPEKVINCDGETGPSAMRRLVPGRGTGAARDIPLGCVPVHRFATVPDEDVLREAGHRRMLGSTKLDVFPWNRGWFFCLEVRRSGSKSSWQGDAELGRPCG